ncbi:MAG: chromate efflux transporter [Gammaproteobacteria bacterium]
MTDAPPSNSRTAPEVDNPLTVFLVFLRLGLTAFGGPVAHLGFFREEFVVRRRWLDERSYADLVALCQFLPGPASSQVGMALGFGRAGYAGALAAWSGFTLPAAGTLILLATGLGNHADKLPAGLLDGLEIATVAVVIHAVWGMAKSLCPDGPRIAMMAAVAFTCWLLPTPAAQLTALVASGLLGSILLKLADPMLPPPGPHGSKRMAAALLGIFSLLLMALPVLAQWVPGPVLSMVDAFYRSGALVFGGGHVVLPLLQAEVVAPGWVDQDTFLAGYAAAQAVPGPLFAFAAFLGATMESSLTGWIAGTVALLSIFLPGGLLVLGTLPFWETIRRAPRARAMIAGVNAAVVGLLLAALIDPVWPSGIHRLADVILALVAVVILHWARWPVWAVVAGCGVAGMLGTLQ